MLQLSSLVTLSSRIHQHMPDLQTPPTGCDLAEHHAPYLSTPQCRKLQNELTTLKTLLQRKLNSSLSAEVLEVGVTGGRGQEGSVRWGGGAGYECLVGMSVRTMSRTTDQCRHV